jgi:hypothetical protein
MAFSFIAGVGVQGSQTGGTTAAINTTGADLIVLILASVSGGGSASISDSKSNTWTPRTDQGHGSNGGGSRIYDCVPTSVGSGHTFTASAAFMYGGIFVLSFSGAHASPFDQQNTNTGTGTTIQPGSVTPSEGNELIVFGAGALENGIDISSVNTGTLGSHAAGVTAASYGGGIAYLIQTSASAVNPTITLSGSSGVTANIATYKSAAGGGGGGNPWYYRAQQALVSKRRIFLPANDLIIARAA